MEYDELLQRAIDPDEKVLWVGKPEDSEPLEGVYKKRFIRKLVAGIVIDHVSISSFNDPEC